MTLEVELINSVLKNLQTLRYSTPIFKEVIKEVDGDYDNQGEEGESIEVYDVKLPDGLFLKLNIGTDSYGVNEFIRSVQFVRGKEKTIKVYEY